MASLIPKGTRSQIADIATEIIPAVAPSTPQPVQQQPRSRFFLPPREWGLLTILVLIAFIPRLILAFQLDAFTDEPIYVIAGNWYFMLARHLDMTNIQWQYNNEHPAFAKILMGIAVQISKYFHAPNQLFPARMPSVLLGTVMVAGVYILGRAPFGRTVAFLAATSLALSPWVAYFSAQALLDTTMTALITLAYLLIWHAIRRPRLYLLCGILTGVAGASKYPAALVVPGMLLFIAYYYLLLRRRLPTGERPPLPWRWWIGGLCLIPLSFFLADPPIWLDPIPRLLTSLQFSLGHADSGHITYWAGQIMDHVPPWMVFYVLFAKITAFITIPAAFFLIFAAIQLVRFHWPGQAKQPATRETVDATASIAFLFIWLGSTLILFGQLTILVGSHYYLPVAPSLFLAGGFGLAIVVRALVNVIWSTRAKNQPAISTSPSPSRLTWRAGVTFAVLALALVGPHLIGIITIPDADGYTSEFFKGENTSLQVMYMGYHDADEWLMAHSKTGGKVGIVGGSATALWYISNVQKVGKFEFTVVQYGSKTFPFDYLVWPMNLVQRGWSPPLSWKTHLVHTINGGSTIYCYIMALDPSTLTT